ncbi:MAG TPA: ribonuclease HII [Abditibacteriaceae bacterium]|jgi:ribonuclease HII
MPVSRTSTKTPTPRPTFEREDELAALGYTRIAGVDEAGRGPLAGPVVAGAVILPRDFHSPHFHLLHDSKKLTETVREKLYEELTPAVEWGVGIIDAPAIDEINIRQASWRAMQEAVADLMRRSAKSTAEFALDYVLIDGLGYGPGPWPYEAIVKGDAKSLSIAAASIIAKVTRDRLMLEMDTQYPKYGFARHKGYGSAHHLSALAEHGPCPIHRMTYAPVRNVSSLRRVEE